MERQLVVVIEGTAALGPYWIDIRDHYIDKIVRAFYGNDSSNQKQPGANGELALVVFSSHGPHSACLVQRSGWTSNLDNFFKWLQSINFCAGGLGGAAIANGLAEALLMLSSNQVGSQISQKHCVLVATSNPYPLPTPVPRPHRLNSTQQNGNAESQTPQWLADTETVAKAYAQLMVTLSVIAPKDLPIFKSIYNAAKQNQTSADPVIDNMKNTQHLVLISENFTDACSALSSPGTSSNANQSMIKPEMSAPIPAVPTQQPSAIAKTSAGQIGNGLLTSQQPPGSKAFVPAAVKMEPPSPLTTAPTLSHMTTSTILHGASQVAPGQFSASTALASQEVKPNVEPQDVQDVKPFPIAAQCPRPPGSNVSSLLNNLSRSATLPGANALGIQASGNAPGMHVSNMIGNGMASAAISTAQTISATAQAGSTTAATTTSLGGLGQVAQNVTQNTFNSGASISGTSGLVAQSISSVNANITGAQGVPGLGQSLAGLGHGLATTSQMGQTGMGINQGGLPGIPAIGVNVAAGTMVPKPSQPVQLGLQGLGAVNGAGNNVQFQNKYIKFWEGVLGGSRQGKSVPICKFEAYRNRTSSESVGADWPSTMQIIRLISQDHITSTNYQGKLEYVVFRTITNHGFLQQLAEKKLSAVIQFPSQTLLLYSSVKPRRMIGLLLPGPQVPVQQAPGQPHLQHLQQQLQQQQLQQQQHLQQQQQMQQQQQHLQQQHLQQAQHLQQGQSQQQQMQQQQPQQHQQAMPSSMGQVYGQGQMQNQISNQARPQLMSQGPFQGQGPPSMPGGGYLT